MPHRSLSTTQFLLTSACCLLVIALKSAEISSAAAAVAASNATTNATSARKAVATTIRVTPAATTAAAAAAAAINASNSNATTATTAAATAAATTAKAVATAATTAAAAVTTAQPTTAAVTTKADRKPSRLCQFPFWHRDQWHHQCLPYGAKSWCSLTRNFTHDEEWRECASYDLLLFKCAIPYHYQGKLQTQCLPLSLEPIARPTFWCPLVPSITNVTWQRLGVDWIFCEAPQATSPDYLKAVGNNRSLEESNAAAAPPKSPGADASNSGGGGGDGGSGSETAAKANSGTPGSALGVALGIVGVILAAVAVTAAFAVHRRYFRNQYKRIDPLLSSESASAEKSSYGGMQAYHD